jgi:glutamate-1-semialdehyde 2,1-aminomutase
MLTTIHRGTMRSQDAYARARNVFPGGNTRTSVYEAPFPIYLARGSGAYVYDVDGNRLLDLQNNFTALIHGHAHAGIAAALAQQASLGVSFSSPTLTEIELAELLCARVPYFEQIRFTNTGSEAVMGAIKAARALTGRHRIAKCEGAYHGSYDPIEISFDSPPDAWGSNRPASVALHKGTPQSVLNETVVIPFNDVELSREILDEEAGSLAAVIVDPMPARLGLIEATKEYLTFLREYTRKRSIILISDEVLTFRLDHAGASTRFGYEPDICAFGKIIGGGMPIGAIGGRKAAMSVFDPSERKPEVYFGGTFAANPMSMVGGRVAMNAMTEEAFARLNALGDYTRQAIATLFEHEGATGQVTGAGSLFRIHLKHGDFRNYRDSYPTQAERQALRALIGHARDNGVLLSPTGLGALSTPMCEEDIDMMIDVLREGLNAWEPA